MPSSPRLAAPFHRSATNSGASNRYMFTASPETTSFASYLSNLVAPCDSFYLQGYSGWALRLARVLFSVFGVAEDVRRLCEADTIAEQDKIWQTRVRPVLLNPVASC